MKTNSHPDLETLMFLIAKLPGLGPKSARRIALYLLKNRDNIMKPLSGALDKVYQNVARCNICGNFMEILKLIKLTVIVVTKIIMSRFV
ncbi:MAG: hypothetical protein RLZZ310_234 [Pseudomonadota bacterium]